MAEQPEALEEVLGEILDSVLNGIHTALPGRVEKYYADDQTADILPLIKSVRTDESGNLLASSCPVLPRVPVIHPRGGGFFVHFPLAVGDFVMLVFQEAAIDQWRAKGGVESHPGDLRRHALGNAVAYPGLYPTAEKLTLTSTTNLVLGFEGGAQIHIQPGPSGQIRLGAAGETDLVALAALVDARISAIRTALNNFITLYNAHTHVVSTTGTASAQSGTADAPTTGGSSLSAQASTAAARTTAL